MNSSSSYVANSGARIGISSDIASALAADVFATPGGPANIRPKRQGIFRSRYHASLLNQRAASDCIAATSGGSASIENGLSITGVPISVADHLRKRKLFVESVYLGDAPSGESRRVFCSVPHERVTR